MDTERLEEYISQATRFGLSHKEIVKNLRRAGWDTEEIRRAFKHGKHIPAHHKSAFGKYPRKWFVYFILLLIALILIGVIAYLLKSRATTPQHIERHQVIETKNTPDIKEEVFTDTQTLVLPDKEKVLEQRSSYIEEKISFIEADLRSMTITLYENGVAKETFKILSKGKPGSWWETPTGSYHILGKKRNHYSSIGHVWMPYSMQFYGNYFVHGWPHYDDGAPVSSDYSGGCIRLSNEDAQKVFDFGPKDMPILVLEDRNENIHYGDFLLTPAPSAPPEVTAEAFLISEIHSQKTILEKNASVALPIASLTKLMTAVVAHEVIYLGRSIHATPNLLAAIQEIFTPTTGSDYAGVDLLYPLLMQSSNTSANLLAGFVGGNHFVAQMNSKAESLLMEETRFSDPSGISAQNISTAEDLSQLLAYIYYKRPFLFEITRGRVFDDIGLLKIGGTINLTSLKNVNEFIYEPELVGVKNGKTSAAGETLATVWNLKTPTGEVPVAIIVLGSENREKDTRLLLEWVKQNSNIKKSE